MLQIFIGVDVRQPVAYSVLRTSIEARASVPVSVTALIQDQLPVKRRGLTDFTFTRYLVPWLMDYRGWGLFLDADMLCLGDIAEVFDRARDEYAVQVVKGPKRFEWPSMMLFNCAKCEVLTPNFIEYGRPQDFDWGEVGELPGEWNRCVGYEDCDDAKLLHYTAGIPCYPETRGLGHYDEWAESLKAANSTVSWQELMGESVHVAHLNALKNAEAR